MQLPEAIHIIVVQHLKTRVKHFAAAAGGCINHGGELKTIDGRRYFIKWNDDRKFPGMFAAEQQGLNLLARCGSIRVPQGAEVVQQLGWQVIMMEYIESRPLARNFWVKLGHQLAALHRQTAPAFGLEADNYIGSLPQRNTWHTSWVDFFITNRLEYQLALAEQHRRIDKALRKQMEKLYSKLHNLLPQEPPALLHGDLWSGNLISDENGLPCLIDPAVYYGHREAELAFTQLFGGFDPAFYAAYQEAYALQPGFDQRAELYNLYPLLVHVNLFGGGYLAAVQRILARYG
jgi:fructosamine-3-kinase